MYACVSHTNQGKAATKETIHQHCCKENWDLADDGQDEGEHRPCLDGMQDKEAIVAELLRGPALLILLEKLVALGPAILGSGEQVIRCCSLVLFLAVSSSETTEEKVKEPEEGKGGGEEEGVDELASVVLGLLGVLLEMGEEQRAEAEEQAFRDLLPLLEKLSQDRQRAAGLAEMSLTIRAMILTRSLSMEERNEQRKREEKAVEARGGMALKDVLVAIQVGLFIVIMDG